MSDLVTHYDQTTTVGVSKYKTEGFDWSQEIFYFVQQKQNSAEFVAFTEGEDHTVKAE